MNTPVVECEFEADVLCAVMQSRWPERVDAELLEHAKSCAICQEVTLVSCALTEEAEQTLATAPVPDAGRVWFVAQMRARREAAKTAGRPITAIQVLAFSAAMGILGACFGATSEWLQNGLKWFRGFLGSVDLSSSVLAGHGLVIAGALALILVVPFAVAYAIGRD